MSRYDDNNTKILLFDLYTTNVMGEEHDYAVSKQEFTAFLENEAKLRVDDFVMGAIEIAEEVHSGVKREDRSSPFLETHTFPVAVDVVKHYRSINRTITSVEIASAILHDVLEDNDRILDWYQTKAYGFEAYLIYSFGNRVYDIATELKVRPLENYSGTNDEERQLDRFQDYCNILTSAEYDVKTIKLADRLNNMIFISRISEHPKVMRYLREAEDFYLAYTMLDPKMPDFYKKIRIAYEKLRESSKKVLAA
jgi:(p)ppGpp synthase/HD superfamily hydrolase